MIYKGIDSIIFDLDGTLWDASITCTKAWNETLQDIEREHYTSDKAIVDAATIRSFSGLKIETIFEQHFNFIPEQKRNELLKVYKINELKWMRKYGGTLYPHVKEVLTELSKDFQLFIVSNCLAGYIENFIEHSGLKGIFTDFESSGNTGLTKSENLKLIVERNKLNSPVYVGDTVWDQEAAQKADIRFIYAAYGFGKANGAKWKIDGLNELGSILTQLSYL